MLQEITCECNSVSCEILNQLFQWLFCAAWLLPRELRAE